MLVQVKVQNPALSHGQAARHIGKQWRELQMHEQQPYQVPTPRSKSLTRPQEMARQMRERYQQLLTGHEPSIVPPMNVTLVAARTDLLVSCLKFCQHCQ